MDLTRTRLKRFGWQIALGFLIGAGLYLGSLMALWQIGEFNERRMLTGYRPGPSALLSGEQTVIATFIFSETTVFYLNPPSLDTVYRPLLNLAKRDTQNKPNWAAKFLLGIES